ncbi:cytidylyltransferase domain-containing protein, partial [Microbacterium sp.]|uniref:cytidylyltransferase domain-containing protein n=1 Tax=Microbacterium sp. TaxID=51671 RepID=UPI002733409E
SECIVTTVAIIQARVGSTRLPAKVLARVGKQAILTHVLARAKRIPGVDRVALTTTDDPADDVLVNLCRGAGVSWTRGQTPLAGQPGRRDVLAGYVAAAAACKADVIVRVTSDCPLLDPAVAGDVLAALRGGVAYSSNVHPPSWYDGCLAAGSRIWMANGRWERICDLVRRRSTEEVMTIDTSTGRLTSRCIYGWHRNPFPSRDWRRVEFVHQRRSRFGIQGAIFTPDHRLLTESGWTEVEYIKPGTRIAIDERALSSSEISVVLGTLLGDGYLARRSVASLTVLHSERQREYAEYKARLLTRLNPKWHKSFRGGFPGSTMHVQFETDWRVSLAEIGALIYRHGRKCVTRVILNQLSALGLAIWYMDDGTLQLRGKSASVRLSTHAFSLRENQMIVRWLQERFSIDAIVDSVHVRARRRTYSMIRLSAEGSRKLFARIAQYVPPSMQYKLSPEFRGRFVDASESESDLGPHFAEVRTVRRALSVRRRYRWRGQTLTRESIGASSYCVDVEGTHNFITKSGVAHNCDIEVFTRAALLEAHANAGPDEREHVTTWMHRHLPIMNVRAPQGLDYSGLKLSVDDRRDLDRVRRVWEALKDHEDFGWRDVIAAYQRAFPSVAEIRARAVYGGAHLRVTGPLCAAFVVGAASVGALDIDCPYSCRAEESAWRLGRDDAREQGYRA